MPKGRSQKRLRTVVFSRDVVRRRPVRTRDSVPPEPTGEERALQEVRMAVWAISSEVVGWRVDFSPPFSVNPSRGKLDEFTGHLRTINAYIAREGVDPKFQAVLRETLPRDRWGFTYGDQVSAGLVRTATQCGIRLFTKSSQAAVKAYGDELSILIDHVGLGHERNRFLDFVP